MSRSPALTRSVAAVVAAALVAAAAGSALAAPERVLIWPRAPDDPTAAAEKAARAAGAVVVSFSPLATRLADAGAAETERQRQAVESVEAALRQARSEALARRWPEMTKALTAAETAALDVIGQPDQTQTLWELQFQRGLAGVWGGDAAAARARFLLALEIDEARSPSRDLYAPDVLKAFTEAVDARASTPARPLPLRVTPADARVVIDGAPVIDNARSRQLRPGLHVVVATAPGHARFARILDVTGQSTLDIALEPVAGDAATRIGASWSAGQLDPSSRTGRALIAAAAVELRATAALVLDVDADGVAATARLITVDDALPVQNKPSIAAAVRAALASRGLGVHAGLDPGQRDDDDDGSIFRSPWLYLGAGGAVVVAALGYLLVTYERETIIDVFPPAE